MQDNLKASRYLAQSQRSTLAKTAVVGNPTASPTLGGLRRALQAGHVDHVDAATLEQSRQCISEPFAGLGQRHIRVARLPHRVAVAHEEYGLLRLSN